jgi:uncharacterized protein (TIGR00725 family)
MIAVVGRRRDPPEVELVGAEAIGRELALLGHTVVTGGRGGVMEAAQIGATNAGGQVVAIVPMDVECIGPATVVVRTGLPATVRNVIMGSTCDAMVALPGSHGTWQEMAVALDCDVPVFEVGSHVVHFPGAVHVSVWHLARALKDAGL